MNVKLCVLVLACDELGYDKMIESIRDTWASPGNIPEEIKVYYVYGHRNGITRQKHTFNIDDCIYSNTPEGMGINIYRKTMNAFEWLLKYEDFDYIFRCNAGSYLDLKMILNRVCNISRADNYYSAFIGCHRPPLISLDMIKLLYSKVIGFFFQKKPRQNVFSSVIHFGSGSGFLISRDLIEKLIRYRFWIPHIVMDDVTIGNFLNNVLGVNIDSAERLDINDVQNIYDRSTEIINSGHLYFMHTINPELMYITHGIKLNQTNNAI